MYPTGHMTFIRCHINVDQRHDITQRRINVDPTSWHLYVALTSIQRHDIYTTSQ